MTTKTLDYYLKVNWKKETVTARKTRPETLGPYELCIDATLEIDIPDVDVPSISEKLEVPQPTVDRIAMEEVFEEEFPDWYETVEAIIADAEQLDEPLDSYAVLGRVMEATKGVPEPEEVLSYINRNYAYADA